MMLKRQTDVRIGILMVDLVEKVYSYMILGSLVQKLIFPLLRTAAILDLGQNDFIKSN